MFFFEKTAMLQKVAPFHGQPLLVYFRQCLLFYQYKGMGWDFFKQHHDKAEIRGCPGVQITFGQLWEIMH